MSKPPFSKKRDGKSVKTYPLGAKQKAEGSKRTSRPKQGRPRAPKVSPKEWQEEPFWGGIRWTQTHGSSVTDVTLRELPQIRNPGVKPEAYGVEVRQLHYRGSGTDVFAFPETKHNPEKGYSEEPKFSTRHEAEMHVLKMQRKYDNYFLTKSKGEVQEIRLKPQSVETSSPETKTKEAKRLRRKANRARRELLKSSHFSEKRVGWHFHGGPLYRGEYIVDQGPSIVLGATDLQFMAKKNPKSKTKLPEGVSGTGDDRYKYMTKREATRLERQVKKDFPGHLTRVKKSWDGWSVYLTPIKEGR